MKLSTAVDQFLVDVRLRGLARATCISYESDLHLLIALAAVETGDSILAFTPQLIRTYLLRLSQRGLAVTTLHRRRATISEFGKWCLRRRLIADDPLLDIPQIKRPRGLPRPFKPDERARLLALPLTGDEALLRALLYYTGLRVTPICGIRLADVTTAPFRLADGLEVPGTLRTTGKGAKTSIKPMLPELYAVVYDWLLSRGNLADPHSFLLAQGDGRPWTRKMVVRRTRRWGDCGNVARHAQGPCEQCAQVPECTPHRFRHTFATWCLERGLDIRIVQVLMDHEDIGTTALYTQVVNSQAFGALLRLSTVQDPAGVMLPGSVPREK